jgi:hypothetical protein
LDTVAGLEGEVGNGAAIGASNGMDFAIKGAENNL